jgi:hypothetical protein
MQAGGRDGKKLGLFPLVTLDDQPPRSQQDMQDTTTEDV